MARYLVEVYVPNRGDALARTRAVATTLARARGVRYVRAILVPKDETCFHVLEAASADVVDAAAREASVAVERIAEAVEVSRRTLRRNHEEEEMSKKLITTIVLVFALATAVGASTALADPPPNRAENGQGVSGVCNMLNVGGSAVEFTGMDNSSHGNGYDIMVFGLIIPACF